MLFISKDDVINTEPENDYFDKVYELIKYWNCGTDTIELQTSGSTGRSKVIIVNRSQIIASIESTRKAFNLTNKDLLFCCLNVNYVAGMMMVFRALHIGTDLMVVEPVANPLQGLGKQEFQLSKNLGHNFFSFVPLQMQTILEDENTSKLLSTAKTIIIGGAAMHPKLEDDCSKLNVPVFSTYGMTETLSHIALKNLQKNSGTFETLQDVEIEVNTNNCLRIKSPSTGDDWIQTNDVVEMKGPHHFILKGRIDNIINSGGVKIQLEEVEWKISERINFPNRFFCFGIPDERLGQKLVLIIESEEKFVSVEQLQGIFGKFEAPKEVFHLRKFIETPSGKVDKLKTINEIIRY